LKPGREGEGKAGKADRGIYAAAFNRVPKKKFRDQRKSEKSSRHVLEGVIGIEDEGRASKKEKRKCECGRLS